MRFSSFSLFCLFLRYLQKDWSLVLKLIFVTLSLLKIFVGKLKNEKKKKKSLSDILLHLKKKKVEFLLSEDQEFITMIPFR